MSRRLHGRLWWVAVLFLIVGVVLTVTRHAAAEEGKDKDAIITSHTTHDEAAPLVHGSEDDTDAAFMDALYDVLVHPEGDGYHLNGDGEDDGRGDGVNGDDDADHDELFTFFSGDERDSSRPAPRWSDLNPKPLSWSHFVQRLHAEGCLQMPAWWEALREQDESGRRNTMTRSSEGISTGHVVTEEEDEEAARTVRHFARFGPGTFCRRPVVLVSSWLDETADEASRDDRCESCEYFLKELLTKASAEMTLLFPSYATLVLVGDPLRTSLLKTPHLHFMPDLLTSPQQLEALPEHTQRILQTLVEATCARVTEAAVARDKTRSATDAQQETTRAVANTVNKDCVSVVTQRVLRRVSSPTDSPFVPGGSDASPALFTSAEWRRYVNDVFDAQGSYAVRVLFVYPHNASLMVSVGNDDVLESDPKHTHFYVTADAFLNSVQKAIWTMSQLTTKGRL